LPFHQERVNRSRLSLYGFKKKLLIKDFLAQQLLPTTGTYKLRLTYDSTFHSFECIPYTIKPVNTLRIIETKQFDYRHKYLDRSGLAHLYSYRDGCDDILISYRGYLTDTHYANIALYDGKKWWTPAHPLLKGVRRASLCRQGVLTPSVIRVKDLAHFKEIRLINSMISLEESTPIPIANLYFPGDPL